MEQFSKKDKFIINTVISVFFISIYALLFYTILVK